MPSYLCCGIETDPTKLVEYEMRMFEAAAAAIVALTAQVLVTATVAL
jgi:hypothetical protein